LCGAWQERRIPQKERPLLGKGVIDEIEYGPQPLSSDLQTLVAMSPARLRKASRHPMCEAATLVSPFPPFARLMTQVALLGEQSG
jgi:hypothetical protein